MIKGVFRPDLASFAHCKYDRTLLACLAEGLCVQLYHCVTNIHPPFVIQILTPILGTNLGASFGASPGG